MATCKDCVHVEVCCSYLSTAYNKCKLATPDFELLKNVQCDECQHFKDRSQFIELPCKVGDILYHPVPLRNMIAEYKIKSFQIYPHCVWVNWTIVDGVATINTSGIYANEIGKTVFFTKEAAEQALKERENNA